MPTHENLAALRSTTAKRGLAGATGGHVEIPSTATGAGSGRYEAQAALGDPFQTKWNSTTGVNEKQRLTPGGSWTGGTFTITFSGQTTATIPWDATHAKVADAIAALSNVKGGVKVSTSETALIRTTAMDFVFRGERASEDVAQVTTTVTGLTGTTPTLTPSTVTAGAA